MAKRFNHAQSAAEMLRMTSVEGVPNKEKDKEKHSLEKYLRNSKKFSLGKWEVIIRRIR